MQLFVFLFVFVLNILYLSKRSQMDMRNNKLSESA